jgi:leader peptidase (prepilin peptidase)/N-methyltransferase
MEHVLPILVAPFVGSFLGVVVQRLPPGRSIVCGRSGCARCGRRLGVLELVPLVSWVSQCGRCRGCGSRIGLFEPTIELAATAVAAWAVLAGGEAAVVWANCLLGWCLLVLGWIDARHMRLPDAITLPLIICGLAVTWWLDRPAILLHALGAIVGFLLFHGLSAGYRRLRGREGLGGGDAKLLAAGGAWVGFDQLALLILLAAVAAITAVLAPAFRRNSVPSKTLAIAFGPFLGVAIWLVRLYGSGLYT